MPLLLTVDEDVDELLDELPPQAVTNAHNAVKKMSQLERFIDAVRSPRWFDHLSQDLGSPT